MPTAVLVPPLGQTVDTLTLAQWLKQEGDAVRQGEPLYVVETDKASLEIEAPASGILRQVTAKPGDEVAVFSTIAMIAAPDEEEETTTDHRPRTGDDRQETSSRIPLPATPNPLPRTRVFVSPRGAAPGRVGRRAPGRPDRHRTRRRHRRARCADLSGAWSGEKRAARPLNAPSIAPSHPWQRRWQRKRGWRGSQSPAQAPVGG